MSKPPKLLERILTRFLPEAERDVVLGDLREEYGDRVRGRWWGPLWYLRMAASIVVWYGVEGLLSPRGAGGDVRVAVRRLRRAPRHAVLSVMVVALAVGANIAALGVAHAVFLGPLPFPEGERLGLLSYAHAGSDIDGFGIAWSDLEEVRTRAELLERLVAVLDWGTVDLVADGEARRVSASFVGAEYLQMMGAEVAQGRSFDGTENGAGWGLPVAVVSRDFWVREMGSDPDVIGRPIQLNGVATVVIGVLGSGVPDIRQRFGEAADLYFPLFLADEVIGSSLAEGSGAGPLNGIVRLRQDATWSGAEDELVRISEDLLARDGASRAGWTFRLEPVDRVFYESVRPLTVVLAFGATLLFLLVLVNLSTLQMVRGSGRRRETSVRAALGASPGRLLRLSLVDAAVISVVGGGLGVVFGEWMALALARSDLLALPAFADIRPGATTVAVAAVFIVVLTLTLALFGWLSSGARRNRGFRPDAERATTPAGA